LIGPFATRWQPPALALAAAISFATPGAAQQMSLAERIQLCGTCHGEDGNSRMENIPSLAGQPAFFILNQLFLMREGVRKIEVMTPFVKDLKDEELDALSQHFAKLVAEPSGEPIDQALAARGAELAKEKRCVSCHGPNLAGQEQIPRIAKQRLDYLIKTLKEYREGRRPGADTIMSGSVAGFSDPDLTALAHFAASR
jgi:cytochrome c553